VARIYLRGHSFAFDIVGESIDCMTDVQLGTIAFAPGEWAIAA